MRPVWATASAAVFLLSEMGSYFEGEVVGGAWADLRTWILGPFEQGDGATENKNIPIASLQISSSSASKPSTPIKPSQSYRDRPHDPESLSAAHRTFLSTLQSALLLTDQPFTHLLRTLLVQIDALVALLHRLQNIQSSLDLEEDEGIVVDAMMNYEKELSDVVVEVDRARKRVDSGLKGIVNRLREIDGARGSDDLVGGSGGGRKGSNEGWGEADGRGIGDEEYEGWKGGGGVERLLMRLDVHYGDVDGQDDDDD
jgi:hypothetical protein